jgi:peptidoglycan/LPS O-acetylase OafA/YrhL
MPQIQSLTGLRGVAAWCVVWAHTVAVFVSPDGSALLAESSRVGLFGMTLFFVLSGFVIHYNYGATLSSWRIGATWSFFAARIARLVPLYLLVLAQFTRGPWPFQKPTFGDVWPYYLTLSQVWLPFKYDGQMLYMLFVPIAWSISTEFFLYLLYVPLALLLGRLTKRSAFMASLVLICLVMMIRVANGGGFLQGATNDYWAFYLSPYCRFPEFLLGALVAQIVRCSPNVPHGWRGAILSFAFAWPLAIYIAAYHPTLGTLVRHVQQSFGFAPGVAALLYVAAVAPGQLERPLISRVAIALGEASYGTYMLHGYVFWPFMRWQPEIVGLVGTAPAVLAMWILIATVSLCSFRLFERPARRITRAALDWPRYFVAEQAAAWRTWRLFEKQ